MKKTLACLTFACMAAIGTSGCSSEEGSPTAGKPGTGSSVTSTIMLETSEGAALTRRKCGSCHYLDQHLTKAAPTLKGIFGRTPTISGVPFKVWDEAALNQWIEAPTKVKKGTRMSIPGNKSSEERQAIIEYLKQI